MSAETQNEYDESSSVKKKILMLVLIPLLIILGATGFFFLQDRMTGGQTGPVDEGGDIPVLVVTETEFVTNRLYGYTREMDPGSMGEGIITLPSDGLIKMQLVTYGRPFQELSYDITDMEGTTTYYHDAVTGLVPDDSGVIPLELPAKAEWTEREVRMNLKLSSQNYTYYYYTRLTAQENLYILNNLDFALDFSEITFDKSGSDRYMQYMEYNGSDNADSFRTVTIHSDQARLTWGSMEPKRLSGPQITVTEANPEYMSLILTSRVELTVEKRRQTYAVREYMRVRTNGVDQYLIDYCRTLDRVIGNGEDMIMDQTLFLGIGEENPEFTASKDGKHAAFVTGGCLFSYSEEDNTLTRIAGTPAANPDITPYDPACEIRPLSVSDDGNVIYLVLGHMNQGNHIGDNGWGVFRYNKETVRTEELLFAADNIAPDRVIYGSDRFISYCEEGNRLYLLCEGDLHCFNGASGKETTVITALKSRGYAISDDVRYIAYFPGEEGTEVEIMDLTDERTRTIRPEGGQTIRIIGFSNHDFAYGLMNEDTPKAPGGVLPMSSIRIESPEGEVLKDFSMEGKYILGAEMDSYNVRMEISAYEGGEYTTSETDYLTAVDETGGSVVQGEFYYSDPARNVMRIIFFKGLKKGQPQHRVATFDESESPIFVLPKEDIGEYFVYARGKLFGIYDQQNAAQNAVEEQKGALLNAKGGYIWQQGIKQEEEGEEDGSQE